ncbi:MAG: zeta toxin family protein [Candidatus Xenobiia bacterium LiM19]
MAAPYLFIIAGPNGAGKTTISKIILENYPFEFLNADEIAMTMSNGAIEEVRISAGKLLISRFDELIRSRTSICIETTLSGLFLAKRIKECRKTGYRINLLYLFLDDTEMAINRIKARVKRGGHAIPDEDVVRRFHRSGKNFLTIYRYLVDKWVMYYNGNERLIYVAEGSSDLLKIREDDIYSLFLKGASGDRHR